MSDTFSCPTCRKNIAKTTVSCPKCAHLVTQLDLDKAVKSDKYARIAVMVIMLPIFTWMVWPDGIEELLIKQQAREHAAMTKAADKHKGFHCLSAWDGSFTPAVTYVTKRLRAPSSFEHVSTRVAPKADNGRHGFFMTYRGENGFGGASINEVSGLFTNQSCELVEISLGSQSNK